MAKTTSMIRARLGEIDLIRDGATSPLASGDNAPVGSQYIGPGGEQWTKTGATATAWAQQLMRAPYYNVMDYGAVGDGVTDDRVAIQLAINTALGQGGGVVFFPAGTYAVDVRVGIVNTFTLSTAAQGKLLFLGEGRASRIYQQGNAAGGDTRLFDITLGCKYVGFKSICLDGSGITNPNEQAHLLHFTNTNATLDDETGRCFVTDVYFNHVNGDGIRLLGNLDHLVKSVLVERCIFEMETAGGQGARSCVAFQRSTEDVYIDCCYMTGSDDQAIDFEPTGNGLTRMHHINRNFFDGFIALSGNGVDVHDRSTFCYNTVVNGDIIALDVQNMVFGGNIVILDLAIGLSDAPLGLSERIANMVICDSILVRDNLTVLADVIGIDGHTVGENHDIVVSGILGINDTNLDGGFGITLRECNRVNVSNCQFFVAVNTAGEGGIVRIEGITENIGDIAIMTTLGVGTGSALDTGVTAGPNVGIDMGNVTTSDCMIRNSQRGINYPLGGNPNEQIMATRNVLVTTASAVVRSGGGVVPIPVDGIGGVMGVSILQLFAAPEGAATAVVGTLGLRSTGGGAGTTLYIKESGSGDTGWTSI